MKIVQIMATDGGRIGGLEKHTFQLCEKLAEAHEVHLFLDDHYRAQAPVASSLHCHYFDFSKGRMNLCLLLSMYRKLKSIQPDLIHAQGGKASKMLNFLLPFLKLPSVATIHGMKNNMKSYRHFSEVITVSQSVAKKILPVRSVHVVHNGVSIQAVPNKHQQSIKPIRKAVAIGRLDPVKGFDRLIDAWQDIDMQLEILGDGPEREQLSQKIRALKLEHKIHLLGHQTDIYRYLASASFVVISSSREGGPIILAEALLAKIPVISTDVGMVSEFIPEAYIAAGFDVEHLRQLINEAVTHLDQLDQEFQTAFHRAASQLSLDAMTQHTLKVYQQALKQF